MQRTRRSGRIAKELPILILGTDTLGKVFSEETHTVVLSRHGAGIVSRYKFEPDEVLTVRLLGTAKEAEMRLVGQIGGEADRHIYGLAFVDSSIEFWPMDFPAPEPFETPPQCILFECSLCGQRQEFAQRDIEEDVYNVNGFVLRLCRDRGTTTRWKKAEGEPRKAPTGVASRSAAPNLSLPFAASPSPCLGPEVTAPGRSQVTASPTALLPAQPVGGLLVSLAELPQESCETEPVAKIPVVAASNLEPQENHAAALDSNGRRINRRKHLRVKVSFSACVRHPDSGDEVVECQNVSKGGLCFHSRRQYSLGSPIEIAASYSEGEPALFSAAKIVRVEPLPGSNISRYGVAYLK